MSTALIQQRAVEIAEQQGFHVLFQKELHAAMEQYHREASARCPDCGERNPASVGPVGFQAREIGEGDWFNVRLDEIERINAYKTSAQFDYRFLYTAPPDAEALRKRVEELESELSSLMQKHNALHINAHEARAECERLRGLLIQSRAVFSEDWEDADGDSLAPLCNDIDAALAARKEG